MPALWLRRDQLQADLLDQARRRFDGLMSPAREQIARAIQLEQARAQFEQMMAPVREQVSTLGPSLLNPVQAASGLGQQAGASPFGQDIGAAAVRPIQEIGSATGEDIGNTYAGTRSALEPTLGETPARMAATGVAALGAAPSLAGNIMGRAAEQTGLFTPEQVTLQKNIASNAGIGLGAGPASGLFGSVEQGSTRLQQGLTVAGLGAGTAYGLSQGRNLPEAAGNEGLMGASFGQPAGALVEGAGRIAGRLGRAATEEFNPNLGVMFGNPPEVARGPGGPRDIQGAFSQDYALAPGPNVRDISQPRNPGTRRVLEGDVDALGRQPRAGERINPQSGYIENSIEDRFAALNRDQDADPEAWVNAGLGLPGDPTGAQSTAGVPRTFSARIPNGARNIVPDYEAMVARFETPIVAGGRVRGFRQAEVPIASAEGLTRDGQRVDIARTPLEYQRAMLQKGLDKRNFYPLFGDYFMNTLARGDEGLFKELNGIFGATASNASPELNLNRTLGVMAAGRSFVRQNGRLPTVLELQQLVRKGRPFAVGGITDADLQKVINIWTNGTTDIGSGFKTPVFSENVDAGAYHYFSPFNVPDTHMLRGMGYTQLGTGPAAASSANSSLPAIANVHAMVRQLSDEFGLTPNQTQSALWYAYKDELAPLNAAHIKKATSQGIPLTEVDPWPVMTLKHDTTLPDGTLVPAGTKARQGTLEATIDATTNLRNKWLQEMEQSGEWGALTAPASQASLTFNGNRLDLPKQVAGSTYLQINPQAAERARFAGEQRAPIAAVPGGQDTLTALGYDETRRSVQPLWDAGIQHVAVPEPRPLAGQPTVRVLLPGASVDTARYAAAQLGRASGANEVGLLWPTAPGQGSFLLAIEHPNALRGETWAANPGVVPWGERLLDQGSLSADGRTLFFADWDHEGQGFKPNLLARLQAAGVTPQELRRYGRQSTTLGAERVGADAYDAVLARPPLNAPGTPPDRSAPGGFPGAAQPATTRGAGLGRTGLPDVTPAPAPGAAGEVGAPGVGPGATPGVGADRPTSGIANLLPAPSGAERVAGLATGALLGGEQYQTSQEQGESVPQSLARGALGFAAGVPAGPAALRLSRVVGRAMGLNEGDVDALARAGIILGPQGQPAGRTGPMQQANQGRTTASQLVGPSGQPITAAGRARASAQRQRNPTVLHGPNGQPLTPAQAAAAVTQVAQSNPDLYAKIKALSQNTIGTYGRLNLLLSPITHIRNLLGNAVAVPWRVAEAGVAPAFEPLFREPGRVDERRYWGEAPAMVKGAFSTFATALDTALDVFRHGQAGQTRAPAWSGVAQSTSDLLSSQGQALRKAGPQFAQNFAEKAAIGFRPLEAGDAFFTTLNEGMELYRSAYREGRRLGLKDGTPGLSTFVQSMVQNPSQKLIDQARAAGEYMTYRQDLDGLGKFLTQFSDVPVVGQVVMPFVRTPYNALKFDLERSPLGAVGVARGLFDKGVSSGEMADRTARFAIGTSLAAFFAYYASVGNITGALPESQTERNAWEAEGKRPFSVRVPTPNGGHSWVSLAYFPGMGANIAAVAALTDAVKRQEKHPDKDVAASLARAGLEMGQAIVQRPLLQSLTDILNAMADPGAGASLLGRVAQGTYGQAIPASSFFRYVTSILDPIQRVSPRNFGEYAQSISPLPAGAPLSSQNLPEARTAYGTTQFRQGEPMLGARGTPLGEASRVAEAALSPFRRTEEYDVPRRYRGSGSDEMDTEIASAINAVSRYENSPTEYPRPSQRQTQLARRYAGRENPTFTRLTERERTRTRRENLARSGGTRNT